MSTSALIAMQNEDGWFVGVRCNGDGYLKYTGAVLLAHWNDAAKIRALMALGEISTLGTEVGEKHPFFDCPACQNGEHRWTRAYGRDRGEWKGASARLAMRFEQLRDRFDVPYVYLFSDGRWSYAVNGEPLSELAQAVINSGKEAK